MKVGYLVGSYVPHHQGIVAKLVPSMLACGIEPDQILFTVNGSGGAHRFVEHGIHYAFQTGGDFKSHFLPAVDLTAAMRVTHWFYINGTSLCGTKFRHLVESGFDPEADCTVAGGVLPMVGGPGSGGRAINDLGMYRADYLAKKAAWLEGVETATWEQLIYHWEGGLYAVAEKKASYPVTGWYMSEGPTDIYGRGTLRITEYYTGVDWYRYKRNYGQMGLSSNYERTL